MKVALNAIEYYLPSKTEDGSCLKEENPDWRIDDIESKTGIQIRHISAPNETATDMAVLAAQKLLDSKVDVEDIDFLIFVTQSPDYLLPTSACLIHDRLGLKKSCMAFDVNLGCSGFIYGLAMGGALIESGIAKGGLLICSDTYTKYIDKHDRTCRPLFSDGAAATHLTASKKELLGPFKMGTDGSGFDKLIVASGGARNIDSNEKKLFMAGSDVFMFTMNMVPKCVDALLTKANLNIDQIDLFVFHQASKLVIDNIIRRLELPEEKVFINYKNIGNTVSATIPIALCDAVKAKRLNNGDQVMLVGFGVGLSWGGCVVRWNSEE
ncbi:MAG: ketoacyl-ACP synthase III [Pseudomonadota bacterium]